MRAVRAWTADRVPVGDQSATVHDVVQYPQEPGDRAHRRGAFRVVSRERLDLVAGQGGVADVRDPPTEPRLPR